MVLRKPAAIFLLLLLLFNALGYRAWFYYAEKKSDRQLEALLDKDQYNEKDLVTLKVSLHMPYQLDESQFRRVDGEIMLDGKLYKYVKRKVSEGDLILLCIPDVHKMSLKKGMSGWGYPASPVQKKAAVSEYEEAPAIPGFNTLSVMAPAGTTYFPAALPEVPIAFPGKPPQLSA